MNEEPCNWNKHISLVCSWWRSLQNLLLRTHNYWATYLAFFWKIDFNIYHKLKSRATLLPSFFWETTSTPKIQNLRDLRKANNLAYPLIWLVVVFLAKMINRSAKVLFPIQRFCPLIFQPPLTWYSKQLKQVKTMKHSCNCRGRARKIQATEY